MTAKLQIARIKITEEVLDSLISDVMKSDLRVTSFGVHDRADATWTLVVEGPDCPDHQEGTVAPYVDGGDLQRNREDRDDS